MKILFVTPTLPTRLSRIRAYNMIKYLSKKHDIYLLSFINTNKKKFKIDDIKKYCTQIETVLLPKYRSYLNCAKYLFTPVPLRVAYYRSQKMHQKIKEIITREQIDIVFIKRKRMAQYAAELDGIPKVLDLCDAVSMHYKRAYKVADWLRKPLYFEEYKKILRYEIDISKKFDKTIFCSPVDSQFLQSYSKTALTNLAIIPIGVDTEYYNTQHTHNEPNTLLFSGVMSAFVNIDAAKYFCDRIFNMIKQEIPDVKLYIVGPQPPKVIRNLAQDNRIIVTGYVPDLREYIAKSTVVICPIRIGAGTRNKILQSLALKKPIVSTTLGAEGLEVIPDEHLLIADNPSEFADKTVRLLRDGKLRTRLAEAGYNLIKSRYSLEVIEREMSQLLESVVNTKKLTRSNK